MAFGFENGTDHTPFLPLADRGKQFVWYRTHSAENPSYIRVATLDYYAVFRPQGALAHQASRRRVC